MKQSLKNLLYEWYMLHINTYSKYAPLYLFKNAYGVCIPGDRQLCWIDDTALKYHKDIASYITITMDFDTLENLEKWLQKQIALLRTFK